MRIPSQFNEDNLYRRRGVGRKESAHTYRRLMRLVIGLALVVVVMKQAARPEMYRTFFGPQAGAASLVDGTPQGGASVSLETTSGSGSPEAPTAPTTQSEISASDRILANQLVHEMPLAEQRTWLAALSRWESGERLVVPPKSLAWMQKTLEPGALQFPVSVKPIRRLRWQLVVNALAESSPTKAAEELTSGEDSTAAGAASQESTAASQESTADDKDASGDGSGNVAGLQQAGAELEQAAASNGIVIGVPQFAALLAALDDAAAGRVVDGSVWRSPDFDRFYRCLDQANQIPTQGIASTGVIPLLQQPDVFLNQLVTVHGTVARAEKRDARNNPFGIESYWQLWLRPADGADRPLVVIVPNVPELVAAVGADANNEEGPPVTIVGRFLKRLAYKSSIGADLAPVVVGRMTHAPVVATQMLPENNSTANGGRMWLLVAAAIVFGVGLALLLMWRTGVTASQARELRSSHRKTPDDFLKGLGEQSQASNASATDQELGGTN